MRPLFAVATGALLLGACADKAAKSWIGSTDAALMASWGAPDRETRTSSGRVLTWTGTNGYGAIVCSSTVVVNNEGIVTAGHSDC
jgi:hypothetical protein